jgi:hypothetical protein
VTLAEAASRSLRKELEDTHQAFRTERAAWDAERTEARKYTDSVIHRADVAETYNKALLEQIARLSVG